MIDLSAFSATRWFGLFGFAFAAAACTGAARRRVRPWRALALIQFAYLTELLLGTRHRLHGAADAWLQSRSLYGHREVVQYGALALLAVLVPAFGHACVSVGRRYGVAAALAVAATGAAGVSMAVEVVSLHATDVVLYRRVHGLLVVGLGWGVEGAVIGACALASLRRANGR